MSSLDGFLISEASFKRLSANCQTEVLRLLGVTTETSKATSVSDALKTSAAKLSVNEMRKFLDGVQDKTRKLLTEIAKAETRFNVGEVLRPLGWSYSDIRGILAGITKRTRTISGKPDAEFFMSVVWDDDVNKAVSEIHPTTHAALRELLLKQ